MIVVKSKTAGLLLLIFPVVIAMCRYVIQKRIKILIIFAELLVPIYIIFTYITAKLFPINEIVQKINVLVTNRIFLNWFIFNKYNLTLFGQKAKLSYTVNYSQILNQWNVITTVDGTYTILLLVLGIVPTVLYILASVLIIRKGVRQNDYIFLAISMLIMSYAFGETVFTNIFFNFIYFYLSTTVINRPEIKKLRLVIE